MGVNKVLFGGETVMDISDSTVTPETLSKGATAYNSAGEKITGTMELTKSGVTTALGYTPVKSVNGKTGESISLTANDVGAVSKSTMLDGGRTYYVDAVNGSDSNNGASATPLATIQKAIDLLPGNLGGRSVRIYVLTDITLDAGKYIKIDGKNNGSIEIRSNGSDPITITGSTNGYGNGIFVFQNSDIILSLVKLNIKQNGTGSGIFVNLCTGFLKYTYATLTGSKAELGSGDYYSSGILIYSPLAAFVEKITSENWYGSGLRTHGNIFNALYANTMRNNGKGLTAKGGIFAGEFVLSGNGTDYECTYGGRVFAGAQTSVPNY